MTNQLVYQLLYEAKAKVRRLEKELEERGSRVRLTRPQKDFLHDELMSILEGFEIAKQDGYWDRDLATRKKLAQNIIERLNKGRKI